MGRLVIKNPVIYHSQVMANGSHQDVERVDEAQESVNEHEVNDQVGSTSVLEFGHGEGFSFVSLGPSLLAQPRREHHQAEADGSMKP